VRVRVDLELCQGHGMCQEEAPQVFRVVDRPGGYARVELLLEQPPQELREQVLAAARYCPNRVITVEEDE
jgi:sterol 14-demethylase